MPIYEYRCTKCQQIFEEFQSGFEEKDATCPFCSGTSRRIISNTTFVLKGSGWYVTDYSKGSHSSGAGGGNGNGSSNGNGNGSSPKKESTASGEQKAPPKKSSETKSDSKSGSQ
ncbi:MAG: FmdB family zinc ribbon protein [Desulfovibrionales bacterium]